MDERIKLYFGLGLSQLEILNALAQIDTIIISRSTLQRRMRRLTLSRRKNKSDLMEIALFILREQTQSGQLLGYRLMHHKCVQAGLTVTMNTVRQVIGVLDPAGVRIRSRKRLKRRLYHSNGPNYLWHIDSYDKLRPYGICVHGAIDGFSRLIIWLEAYFTSSNPALVSGYYVDAVTTLGACPLKVRADLGTENSHVEQMHCFLRANEAGDIPRASFIYGSSNHNQRIEAWWSLLRRSCSQFWMNVFQDLKDAELFSGDYLDKKLMQFCFMNLFR